MDAGLGWIDFSNSHRDKVFSVLEMLSDPGTVDELGIGSIRDSIADWLFPGISTIQTRPKYFILLPQILLSYLKKYQKSSNPPSMATFLRQEENNLMQRLAQNYNYELGKGVIGVYVAKTKGELLRKPSSIYWNGLRTHGFINTHLSLSDYLKMNDLSNKEGNDSEEDSEVYLENKFAITTPPGLEIPENIDLNLSKTEANFLRDHFIDLGPEKNENNLLRQILLSEDRIKTILDSSNFREMAGSLMDDPTLAPETLEVLKAAIDFDYLVYGANLRYNIILNKKTGLDKYHQEWKEWEQGLTPQENNFLDLDIVFGSLALRTPFGTQHFIKAFKEEVLKSLIDTNVLDALVINQELRKKGARAKLHGQSAPEEINGWVGIRNLEYRYATVRTLVKDLENANA